VEDSMLGFQVAIDGPAGSGKSTISKKVAEDMNLIHIDTGAMYRAITYMAIKEGINLDYEESYAFIKDITIEYTNDKIYASGEDVTEKIRSDIVTKNVSKVSSFPSVRTYLVEIQKASAKGKNVIMDGRDIGTVVLPNADLKIFLTANIEERAKRRMRELQLKGRDIDLTTMIKDIEERDKKDSERKASPLIIPKDAIIVDTTHYTIEDTVNRIKHEILKKETYHGRD